VVTADGPRRMPDTGHQPQAERRRTLHHPPLKADSGPGAGSSLPGPGAAAPPINTHLGALRCVGLGVRGPCFHISPRAPLEVALACQRAVHRRLGGELELPRARIHRLNLNFRLFELIFTRMRAEHAAGHFAGRAGIQWPGAI
jgi:hypothetical protein